MAKPKGAIGRGRQIDAADLREVLKPIYDKLRSAGVPPVSMPTNDALVAQLLQWIDKEKIDSWVAQYAQLMARR